MYIGTFFFVSSFSCSFFLSLSFSLSFFPSISLFLASFLLRSLSLLHYSKTTNCATNLSINFVRLLFSARKARSSKNRHLCSDSCFLKARNVTKSNQNSRVSPRRRIIKPSSLTEFIEFIKGYRDSDRRK